MLYKGNKRESVTMLLGILTVSSFVKTERFWLFFVNVYLVINLVSLQCFPFSVLFMLSFAVWNTYPDLFCVLFVACLEWRFCLFAKIAFFDAFVCFYQCFQALPFSCHIFVQVSSLLFCCCLYKNCSNNFRHCFLYNFLWFLIRLPLTSHKFSFL